ncbi:MAG: beta-glucosidase, partial [Rhodomicrobium sp.]
MQDLTPTVNSGAPDFLADEAQLDLVQRQTFGYFWDFAHPGSGMAYDRGRSDGTAENDLIAVGGTGFGIMAMLVAV